MFRTGSIKHTSHAVIRFHNAPNHVLTGLRPSEGHRPVVDQQRRELGVHPVDRLAMVRDRSFKACGLEPALAASMNKQADDADRCTLSHEGKHLETGFIPLDAKFSVIFFSKKEIKERCHFASKI